jgi:hypothetical protein
VNDRYRAAERAAAAYRALADLAETVEDEWQYVTDLVEAYSPGIEALSEAGPARLTAEQAAAVDEAIAEIGMIADPHKAIDWLSTFPYVVGLALGGGIDAAASVGHSGHRPAGAASTAPDPEPDDDSPFRTLLGRGR